MVVYIFTGVIGFSVIEGWTILDSVYYLVATFTTVGYGDIAPKVSND